MYQTQLFVLFFTVSSTFSAARVLKVQIHDQDDKVVQFTMNKVESFTWKSCGGNGFGVTDLSLTPDPLEFPGTLHLAMKAYFNTTIQAPLPTTLLIEKEVAGKYIKIPCIDSFGSCSYDDLCELLDEASCPDPLVKAGIPCQCPFKPAQYTLPTSDFDVETSFFPSGGYHMKGSISMNGKLEGCLEIFFSVA